MFGIIRKLIVRVFADANEAIAEEYTNQHKYKGAKVLEIHEAVVVRNGTRDGNSTIDFVLQDAEGNKYVAIITGALLSSIPV